MNKVIILLFAISLSLFSSCKKDEVVPPTPTLTQGKATFKVGSVEKMFTKANSFNSGILALGNTSDEVVSLSFPIPTTFPTTYDMTATEMISASYILNGTIYNATNGISGIGAQGDLLITIEKYTNANISGTFEFTAINGNNEQVVITQGVFTDIPDL